jgi:hypothetical protein
LLSILRSTLSVISASPPNPPPPKTPETYHFLKGIHTFCSPYVIGHVPLFATNAMSRGQSQWSCARFNDARRTGLYGFLELAVEKNQKVTLTRDGPTHDIPQHSCCDLYTWATGYGSHHEQVAMAPTMKRIAFGMRKRICRVHCWIVYVGFMAKLRIPITGQ